MVQDLWTLKKTSQHRNAGHAASYVPTLQLSAALGLSKQRLRPRPHARTSQLAVLWGLYLMFTGHQVLTNHGGGTHGKLKANLSVALTWYQSRIRVLYLVKRLIVCLPTLSASTITRYIAENCFLMDTLPNGLGSPEQPPLDSKHHHVDDSSNNSRLRQFFELAAERNHTPMFSRFDRLAAMCLLHRQHEIIQLEERIRQNLDNPQGGDHLLRSLTPLLLEYCNFYPRRLDSEG